MARLLKARRSAPGDGASPPGADASQTASGFACATCGSPLKRGQDWCLECGTAAPGRLGARAGWRAAFTVVGVTLLLVVGAVAAAYAALTTDADHKAAAPSAGNGAPIAATPPAVTPPAAVTPGATGPGTTPPAAGTPPVTTTTPGTTTQPLIPTTPPAAGTNTTVTPPAVTPPPATTTTPPPPPATTTTTPTTTTPPPPPPPAAPKAVIVKLKADQASTYDPGKRAGAEFGPAANAVDASPKTVWDVTTPADGKPIGAGLLLDLGAPYALHAIKIDTPTEGFHVEVYGAVSDKQTPEDILDKRWEHLTDIKSVTNGKIVSLLSKSKSKQELLLLYITTTADPTDPRAAIGKVTIAATP